MYNAMADLIWGSEWFGYGTGPIGNPAIYIFTVPIYIYAILIVSGMCIAVLLGAYFFKKRGYDPYDICIYALVVIPMGVLGARLYVYIFPWAGQSADWTTFFNFRSGGLGIYGGVIWGYIGGFLVCKVKKQDIRIVSDSVMPGLLISIGRWGNFANQEAFGPVITNPSLQWFPFGVFIESDGMWHYATFFYESMATLLGFIICLLLLRSKKYKLGWLTCFYGIYYGIVRILVESLRTDSLYLWIGNVQTDIKISQLVSVFTIVMGLWTLTVIYRKELHALYSKLFKSERDEVAHSRWILTALAVVMIAVSIVMYVLGGESRFIVGFVLDVAAIYSIGGIFALQDRLQLYCKQCGKRLAGDKEQFMTQAEHLTYKKYALLTVLGLLITSGIIFFILGIAVTYVDNQIVLGIILLLCAFYCGYELQLNNKQLQQCGDARCNLKPEDVQLTCECGQQCQVKLNKLLLFFYPFKVYKDYGVENLHPYVDPEKEKKKRKKAEKQQNV